ncbi:MAG: hypothetical protein ACD_60C00023G0002 [uncultured bacterium]|nr:MAG: hypothetical protein ACD_60C00023G0002 [uncultured bacterium]
MNRLKMLSLLSLACLSLLNTELSFARDSTTAPASTINVPTATTLRHTYVLWHGLLWSNSWIWLPNRCLPGYQLDGAPSCAVRQTRNPGNSCAVNAIDDPLGQLFVSDWSDPSRYQLHSFLSGGMSSLGCGGNHSFLYECVVYCNRQTPPS